LKSKKDKKKEKMINYYKRKIGGKRIKIIDSFENGCWINVVDPSSEEINFLCKKFKLEKRNILSGLDENEIPRLEFVEDNFCVFTKIILPVRRIQTFLIVIEKNFILTLSKEAPIFLERIFSGEVEAYTTQKLKSLIKILFLNDEVFEKETIKVVKSVQLLESQREEIMEEQLEDLLKKEKFLNNLVSSCYYLILLYERMIKKVDFFKEDEELIKDLIEEINEKFNICKSSLKTISNIRNHWTIILSNRLNKTITILTVFTIFITIPAAISGVYGMNVILPLQDNHFAFYCIVGIIVFTWVIFIGYLKKRKII
jgi:magnesium transporter